ILRRSGRSVRLAATRARDRRPPSRREPEPEPASRRAPARAGAAPVDAAEAYPDVVGEESTGSLPAVLAPSPLLHAAPTPLATQQPLVEDPPTLFDEPTAEHADYKLPDAGVLNASPER